MWILLVEDNSADVLLVREALGTQNLDGELMVLSDGEQALDFIKAVDAGEQRCPDLFILDLNLPKRSGWDVLERIRESACRVAPLVVLTSSDNEKDKENAARLGVSRYVRKPTRLAEFLSLGKVFAAMIIEQ